MSDDVESVLDIVADALDKINKRMKSIEEHGSDQELEFLKDLAGGLDDAYGYVPRVI